MRKVRVFASFVVGAFFALLASTTLAGGGGACRGAMTERSGVEVALQSICFEPTILYVAPGQTVTWTNLDSVPHTVTSATFVWENRTLDQGNSLRVAFEEPGIYPYFCLFHTYMGGAVVVGELDASQQAFLAALDQRQQTLAASWNERADEQQQALLTALDTERDELQRSLRENGSDQPAPLILALVALGGGLGGATVTLALRRNG